MRDPNRAKMLLARAFDGFAARNDARRQLLTAAAAVECHYYEWADFAPLDRWIAEFERLLEPNPPFLSTADALRIRSALLIALLFRQPGTSAHRGGGADARHAAGRARHRRCR